MGTTSPTPTGPIAGANYTMADMGWTIDNGTTVIKIGVYSDAAQTGCVVKIVQNTSGSTFNVLYSENFDHPGGGWHDVTIATPFAVPATGIFYAASYVPNKVATNTSKRGYKAGNIVGSSGWVVENASATRANRVEYDGNPPPPPPPSTTLGIVGFHQLSSTTWTPGPIAVPNSIFFAPTYSNSTDMCAPSQLASIKAQIDQWKTANGLTELRAGGHSGGTATLMSMLAAFPGYFTKASLYFCLYDFAAWAGEANASDLSVFQAGMGGPIGTTPRPYFERAPRWTLTAPAMPLEVFCNGGLQDDITPIHHTREAFARFNGMPNVTAHLQELNIGHSFTATCLADMTAQLS